MQLVDSYPIVITERLAECRDFYSRRLGFEAVFEASWFVLLNNGSASIAFMTPDHPSTPPSPAAHTGDGMFLTLQVEDAAAEYERLVAEGATFALTLTDEPWGQRRFALTDPAGVWLDIVEQTQPAEGWWAPYIS